MLRNKQPLYNLKATLECVLWLEYLLIAKTDPQETIKKIIKNYMEVSPSHKIHTGRFTLLV